MQRSEELSSLLDYSGLAGEFKLAHDILVFSVKRHKLTDHL
jgi:hypothetical protein